MGDYPPSLETIFGLKQMFWWGDLDLAGIDIYQRLKSKFPTLQLSAAYRPMITLLKTGNGHPYAKCTGKEDQVKRYTNAKWGDDIKSLVVLC